ncbi:hypothetical protein SAMN04487782_3660 [Stenotrophomonas maltophilia]|nr:hypothetical protein SAMN04487782_3660 [Stenotrophomonas maltophilia]
MNTHMRMFCLVVLAMAAPDVAVAAAPALECRLQPAKPIPRDVLTNGFFEAHPDLRWRGRALGLYREGKYAQALRSFRTAALYADKFSQSMVARMYWQGVGTAVDRPLAYAWMDLAAERMYHDFLRQRELYWEQLDETERAQAVHRGQAVYARFGDAQAKPRMERKLRQGLGQITGSRTGHISPGLMVASRSGPDAMPGLVTPPVPAQLVYDKAWWDPQRYWCNQDAFWARPLDASVEVGELEQLPNLPPAAR